MIKPVWHRTVAEIKLNITALFLASRDGRLPLRANIAAALVLAYALSPIDLIPDFIPVLGYLDDIILLPLGVMLVIHMIPADLWQGYRARAASQNAELPRNYFMAGVIISLWLSILVTVIWLLAQLQS